MKSCRIDKIPATNGSGLLSWCGSPPRRTLVGGPAALCLSVIVGLFGFAGNTAAASFGSQQSGVEIDVVYKIRNVGFTSRIYDGEGSVVFDPQDHGPIAPIEEFAHNGDHIFTRHYGLASGSSYTTRKQIEIDRSVEYYFIIDKSTQVVDGPLTKESFDRHAAVFGNTIRWRPVSIHWAKYLPVILVIFVALLLASMVTTLIIMRSGMKSV